MLADVANFYETIDHEKLNQDVVELTGDVLLAEAIQENLLSITGRAFGIPQGPRSSDALADLYLAGVDRELARSAIPFWRFNDDYLLTAQDAREPEALLLVPPTTPSTA